MHTMACVCNSDRGNAGGYFVVATSRLGLQLHVLRVCDLGDCEWLLTCIVVVRDKGPALEVYMYLMLVMTSFGVVV